jgi:hypothetical protein
VCVPDWIDHDMRPHRSSVLPNTPSFLLEAAFTSRRFKGARWEPPPRPTGPPPRPTGPSRYPPLRARPPSPGRPGTRPTGPSRYPPLPRSGLTPDLMRMLQPVRRQISALIPPHTLVNNRDASIAAIQRIIPRLAPIADAMRGTKIDVESLDMRRQVPLRLALLQKVPDLLRAAITRLSLCRRRWTGLQPRRKATTRERGPIRSHHIMRRRKEADDFQREVEVTSWGSALRLKPLLLVERASRKEFFGCRARLVDSRLAGSRPPTVGECSAQVGISSFE